MTNPELARRSYHSEQDAYYEALSFATQAHKGQRRKYGAGAYILHPIRVAGLLARLEPTVPTEVLDGCLLHDVVEDTPTKLSYLRKVFPQQTCDVVSDMTRGKPTEGKLSYLERLMLRPINPYSPLVKMCDRIDNLTDHWENAPHSWRRSYLDQSVKILALAELGIHPARRERLTEHPAYQALKDLVEQRLT